MTETGLDLGSQRPLEELFPATHADPLEVPVQIQALGAKGSSQMIEDVGECEICAQEADELIAYDGVCKDDLSAVHLALPAAKTRRDLLCLCDGSFHLLCSRAADVSHSTQAGRLVLNGCGASIEVRGDDGQMRIGSGQLASQC